MGVQWRKENPNPRVHRSSGKLGEPHFPLERVDPRVGIFLSPLDTHDGFYLSHPRYLTPVAPHVQVFIFIPRHLKKCGVLCYTLQKKFAFECPSVRLSVRPSVSVSFPGSILSIYRPIFFKLCIGVHIRKEWSGIEDG